MSVVVDLADLPAKTQEYGWAYLLTVRDDGRPQVVAVSPEWDGADVVVDVGRGTAANAAARAAITLCYPPTETDGFSLIVDGTAAVHEQTVRFTPASAVLHRPAPSLGAAGDG